MPKLLKRILCLSAVFGGFFIKDTHAQCPNGQSLQTITYDTTVVGSGNMNFTLPLFDPSVGTLYSVTADLKAFLVYKYSLTNSKPFDQYYEITIDRRDILRASSLGNPNFNFFPTSFDRTEFIFDDIDGNGVPPGESHYEHLIYNPRSLTNTYTVPFLGSGNLTLFYQSNTNAGRNGSTDVDQTNVVTKDSVILTMTYNYCPAVSLPSKSINIKSSLQNQNVVLQWSSEERLTSGSFEILKSVDGRTYTSINKQSINQQQLNGYSFLHRTSKDDPGKAFFRVKQTDQYGNVSYSKVITVVLPSTDNSYNEVAAKEMVVYPSVTTGNVNISIPKASTSDEWLIKVISISGQVMQQGKYRNVNPIALTLSSNLNSGMHIVEATNLRTQASYKEKIVVQR